MDKPRGCAARSRVQRGHNIFLRHSSTKNLGPGFRQDDSCVAIDGRIFLIAYTVRGTRTRIISARRAHDNEEELFRSQ
ncbi:MAG: BrnT family toxin [Alphaproteobacteria bacterium]|nr:BrnT family toxin [Alphaproteobacteria bacterium]